MKKIYLTILIGLVSIIAYGHTDTTNVGRLLLTHPDFQYEGGAGLHTAVRNGWTKIGDNINGRYEEFSSIADSTLSTHTHTFGVAFAELCVLLYTGSGTNLVRVQDPSGDGWTIAANGGNPKTQIDITTPGSGGPHTFAIVVSVGTCYETFLELDDTPASYSGDANDICKVNSGETALEFGLIVNANVDSSAAIARSKVANGTADYVIINSGTGAFSEEQYLAAARGGSGIDSSASTGIPEVNSGTWTVGAVLDDLANADETGKADGNVLKYNSSSTDWEPAVDIGEALAEDSVFVGNGSNVSAAVDTTSVGDIEADVTNGLTLKRVVTPIKTVNDAGDSITVSDYTILGDTSSAGFTSALPAASGNDGLILVFKKTSSDSNTWTIDGNSTETIDAIADFEIRQQYDTLTIQCDGSNWIVLDFITTEEITGDATATATDCSTTSGTWGWLDESDTSLVVPKGTWILHYSFNSYIVENDGGDQSDGFVLYAGIGESTEASTDVPGEGYQSKRFQIVNINQIGNHWVGSFRIQITSATTYRPKCRFVNFTDAATINTHGQFDSSGNYLKAVRIK